jgi:hypothetical protein
LDPLASVKQHLTLCAAGFAVDGDLMHRGAPMNKLPERANLAYVKKRAKDLIRLCRDRDPEVIPSQRQGPPGTGQGVQSVHLRLAQLLRQISSDAVASNLEEDRSLYHPPRAP